MQNIKEFRECLIRNLEGVGNGTVTPQQSSQLTKTASIIMRTIFAELSYMQSKKPDSSGIEFMEY